MNSTKICQTCTQEFEVPKEYYAIGGSLLNRMRVDGEPFFFEQICPKCLYNMQAVVTPSHNATVRSDPPSINIGGDVVGRDKHVINIGTSNRELSDQKIEEGRKKIQQWGQNIAAGNWDWHALGHALKLAHEAIEHAPEYQRPWNLLADVYHRIGKIELANLCLVQSRKRATEGPNFPGRFYREVEGHIKTGYPFNIQGGIHREIPPQWFEEKYQRYWMLDV